MAERKFLKPAGGQKVRKPDYRHLAAAGEWVEFNSYWVRRIAAGEVVEVAPPSATKAAKSASKE